MGCIALLATAAFTVGIVVYMSGLVALVLAFIAFMGGYMSGLVAFVIGFLMLS